MIGCLRSQEAVWSDPAIGDLYYTISPCGDFDGDGSVDLLAAGSANYGTLASFGVLRVLSGASGAVLHQQTLPSGLARSVGDMDGDGRPEYATVTPFGYRMWEYRIMSLATNQMLWSAVGSAAGPFGFDNNDTTLAANLDLDGDGLQDLVLLGWSAGASDAYAYDHAGNLLYHLPIYPYGVATTCAAMPDMDGDGAQEFLLGIGSEPTLRGIVVLVSGRTGAVLRITVGQVAGARIGGVVADAGDVDGDGVHDYCAASHWSAQQLSHLVISGATGAVLYNWTGYWADSDTVVADVDVDQDGVPDVILGNAGLTLPSGLHGQIRALSGRDGSVLWNLDATDHGDNRLHPDSMVPLGVQPGSPYPVFAVLDMSLSATEWCRIRAIRTNLPGAGPVLGTPGSRSAVLPRIGMRLTSAGVRMQLANAPAGAFALLAIAGASETAFGGLQLPLALDPLGLIGCTAYVPPTWTATTTTGTLGNDFGFAAIDLPLPSLATTGGLPLAAQWLALDPATGACASTARHEFRVP